MADLLDNILKLNLFGNQSIFRQIFNKNLSPKKCHLLKINSKFSLFFTFSIHITDEGYKLYHQCFCEWTSTEGHGQKQQFDFVV